MITAFPSLINPASVESQQNWNNTQHTITQHQLTSHNLYPETTIFLIKEDNTVMTGSPESFQESDGAWTAWKLLIN